MIKVQPEGAAAMFRETSASHASTTGGTSRELILWTVVAILCAVTGIVVGTLFGAR